MPTFQTVRLVGALRESFYDYKCSHMHQRHRYGMVHHRYCAEKHTYQPTRSAGCSSFALRNAPGSKLRRSASRSVSGGDIMPYRPGGTRYEPSVPNVPPSINALGLRGRCGRPVCEGWGGTEESEHRKQWQSHWETKARTQARKCIRAL